MTPQPKRPAFGTLLTSHMAVTHYPRWQVEPERDQAGRLDRNQSRGAHAALCQHLLRRIQGIPPRRWFRACVRMDRHMQRLLQSARLLVLPEPDVAQVADMVRSLIKRCRDAVPEAPGALYCVRLFLVRRRISARPRPRPPRPCWWYCASPVWDYFAGGEKPLRILVDDQKHALRAAHGHGENRRQLRRRIGAHHECA